ncbi:hypothetical protein D187_003574 [Cystobacter fuscus DSM 2262]|uniref:Uncharacterized protein n=1 Tax=Cystobacter fuscus (strain ATCC 25194 / DSM 2262 / NBRC 100088 / M29) TaxID=1242864 RepID=S9QBZ9_CYSF2|nr:hypothetical protein [Cystobacter fuscus]EPX58859.1 hypothetical protein D187_003574 [Cystobacter fuscus DSM 2262]
MLGMADKAHLWLSAHLSPSGDGKTPGTPGSPLKDEAHGWLPDRKKVELVVTRRFPALCAEPADLDDLVGEFYKILLNSLQPCLGRKAEVPNFGALYWMYANALHKAASRRNNLLSTAVGDTGEELGVGDDLEVSPCATHAAERKCYLGETLGLARADSKLLRLYELSRPQATMLLELALLGKINVSAWAELLQKQSAKPLSRNACNVILTKQTAMAVFRFLVLLHDVEQEYETCVQEVAWGHTPEVLLPPMPPGCDHRTGWKCFALAYFTPGIRGDKAATEEAIRCFGVSPQTYRAARGGVSLWVLKVLSRQASASVVAEYRSTFAMILNLPNHELPTP